MGLVFNHIPQKLKDPYLEEKREVDIDIHTYEYIYICSIITWTG